MPPLRRRRRIKPLTEDQLVYTRERKRRAIVKMMDLKSMSHGIRCQCRKLQLAATTQLLNLVSHENKPMIDKVVKSGVVPRLVEFIGRDDSPHLQFVAAGVLKNITSGSSESTQAVIDSGAVPVFVKLLGSSDLAICEQVLWSLGNIAGESSQCRDLVLSCGALHPLLTLLEKHYMSEKHSPSPGFYFRFQKTEGVLRVGTWCLANILEEGPIVPFEQVEFAIRVLSSLIHECNICEVAKEACWALFFLSQCGGGIETTMYEADLIPKLAEFCDNASVSALVPAIRAIRSILSGTTTLDKRAIEAKEALYLSQEDVFMYSQIQKEVQSLHRLMDSMRSRICEEMEKERQREHELLVQRLKRR